MIGSSGVLPDLLAGLAARLEGDPGGQGAGAATVEWVVNTLWDMGLSNKKLDPSNAYGADPWGGGWDDPGWLADGTSGGWEDGEDADEWGNADTGGSMASIMARDPKRGSRVDRDAPLQDCGMPCAVRAVQVGGQAANWLWAGAIAAATGIAMRVSGAANTLANTVSDAADRVGDAVNAANGAIGGALEARSKLQPSPNAEGPHSTYKRDPVTGKVTGYETYGPPSNPRNPNPWEPRKRYDGQGKSHFDKPTGEDVPTPHVKTRTGTRPAQKNEMPK